jgi:hypothetical protein
MKKDLFLLLCLLFLSGCLEREIYTDISDPSYISLPPSTLHIKDLSSTLKSDFKNDSNAPIRLEVYTHSVQCTNAQSRSLGTDFDGYIRITIKEQNTTIARAQMDYKGEPDAQKVQYVYDHLIKQLQWR